MIREQFRRFKQVQRQKRAVAEIAARPDVPGAPHGLPGPLIVSLTSYPARFDTLALTLRALLRQSVQPDKVILWLARGDEESLPEDVLALRSAGLEVATCPDWRSYKKIIPTLAAWPEAYIATADDDVYYPHDWLATLRDAISSGARIACRRGHRIVMESETRPLPYEQWDHNISHPERSPLVFLTGVMGVIYAPDVFHEDILKDGLFKKLCPGSDDVWLYWMHRLRDVEAQKIGHRARILEWRGSQAHSLRNDNIAGLGNDRAIQAMRERYGWPA